MGGHEPGGHKRLDVEFESHGERCAAWLWLPANSIRPPVVVMAHGFGATRRCGLAPFAETFAGAGLAVLAFDYRHFGDSDGEPRHLVSPHRQLDDWRAGISYVRSRDDVDANRLGLWGTSFAGGHVISLAAEDPGVGAIVAQVPYVDSRAAPRPAMGAVLRTISLALVDRIGAIAGRPPITVPIVGDPGSDAVLAYEGWQEAYLALAAPAIEAGEWENAMPARSVLEVMSYRPVRRARDVTCPALLITARQDEGIPVESVQEAAASMRNATLEICDCDHFDVYTAERQERVAAREADFLGTHLA